MKLGWHVAGAALALLMARSEVVRGATPEPTTASQVMGGGVAASQSGDPILALMAVVLLGCLVAVATLALVRITDGLRARP